MGLENIMCELCGEKLPMDRLNFAADPRADVLGIDRRQWICDPCLERASNEVYDGFAGARMERIGDAPGEVQP